MNQDDLYNLGEISDTGSALVLSSGDDASNTDVTADEESYHVNIEVNNPDFEIDKLPNDAGLYCKTCHTKISNFQNIDGECPVCARRRLRNLESTLVQRKFMEPEHKYCAIEGHREIAKNKLFPDWCGKIVINGVELYPVVPLCGHCIDILTTYLVYFLEERGIIRRGSGHVRNEFDLPYNRPLKNAEILEYTRRLNKFLPSAEVFVLNKSEPIHALHLELINARKSILRKYGKEVKEWAEEKSPKLPKTSPQIKEVIEKYYDAEVGERMCMATAVMDASSEERSQTSKQMLAELELLNTQPVPESVVQRVLQDQDLKNRLLEILQDLEMQGVTDPEEQRELLAKQESQGNGPLSMMILTNIAPNVRSVGEMLEKYLDYAFADLISKSGQEE